jgi:two-component system LytT family sensor kinase
MKNTVRRNLGVFAVYILALTALGCFFFTQDLARKLYFKDPTPWWRYLVSWIKSMYIIGALIPAVLWLGRRFPFERRYWVRRTALHLVCSMGFALVMVATDSFLIARMKLFPLLMGTTFSSTFPIVLIVGFNGNVLNYWIVLGIQRAVGYYRRYQEREKEALRLEVHTAELRTQLIHAQLSALKMQLQPHFLFNTLNAIMVLVRQQKMGQAEEMLVRLGDLLRCVLDDVEAQEVTLRRELEYLQLYLDIEQVRFQDRLRVEIDAAPDILDAAVPQMGLQPIVENAIRHGIGRRSAAGRVRISAARVDGRLEVRVQDDGPGLPPADLLPAPGIGLANTRARLRQLYGDAAHLEAGNGAQGGAVVTMVLPYHLAPAGAETEVMEVHALDGADRRR